MIGLLLLPVLGTEGKAAGPVALRAVLENDGTWVCPDPEWAAVLNERFPRSSPGRTGDASFGVAAGRFTLYRAAERLSARVVLAKQATPD